MITDADRSRPVQRLSDGATGTIQSIGMYMVMTIMDKPVAGYRMTVICPKETYLQKFEFTDCGGKMLPGVL